MQGAERRLGEVAADRVDDDVGAAGQRLAQGLAQVGAPVAIVLVAPTDRATSSFSSDDATAVTEAPSTAASCTAASPTPPPAPSTMTLVARLHPGHRAQHVVRGAVGDAEAGGGAIVDARRVSG